MSVVVQQSVYPSAGSTMTKYINGTSALLATYKGTRVVLDRVEAEDAFVSSRGGAYDAYDADVKPTVSARAIPQSVPRKAMKSVTPAGKIEPEKMEFCEIDSVSCDLPVELFDLFDLSEILSLETWNDVLSDDDRQQLAQFLPPVDGEDMQEALQDVLAGFNVSFGNPRDTLWHRLRSGQCNSKVATYKKGHQILQRRQYYHNLRQYHNKMVNSLLGMKRSHQLPAVKAQVERKQKHVDRKSGPSQQREIPRGAPRMELPVDTAAGFSILHFLSAVRSAMLRTRDCEAGEIEWLSIAEIVDRVRNRPGDARVLRVEQDLTDLVRQALLVLQTKAPPGTRLWKPFVQQKKQNKGWSWCGIVPQVQEDFSMVHVELEYWGVPEKALAKLQERLSESLNASAALKSSATPVIKAERLTDVGPAKRRHVEADGGGLLKKRNTESDGSVLKQRPGETLGQVRGNIKGGKPGSHMQK